MKNSGSKTDSASTGAVSKLAQRIGHKPSGNIPRVRTPRTTASFGARTGALFLQKKRITQRVELLTLDIKLFRYNMELVAPSGLV